MATDSIFMGNSRYSRDFETVLERSVAIASLPLVQMQQQAQRTSDEASALNSLDLKFTALQSALASLENAQGASSYSTDISNAAVLSASLSAGALEGSYAVEVTSLGAYTNTMSVSGATKVTNPETGNLAVGPFTLHINSDTPITLSSTKLSALVAEINDKAGASVQASVVNVGSTTAPDYRLSLQSRKLRADTIQLKAADGSDLLSQLTAGKPVSYKVNGADEQTNESRTLTLSPGLAVTLKSKSETGIQTILTVTRNANSLRNSLTEFTSAYNGVLDELDKHRGSGGGTLKGNATVASLAETLRALMTYSGTGALNSPAMAGLVLDDKGRMSVDSALFNAATTNGIGDLNRLLGSKTSTGFLKFASDQITGITAPGTGYLKAAITRATESTTEQNKRLEQEQERIDQLRESLQAQLSAADALIASLEQQATYINSMFEAMRMANE